MKLAIVGAEEHTRSLAPWYDNAFEVWVLNEYPTAEWCKRFDASFQMHTEDVYTDPNNDKDKGHWNWLQEKRGKPIYMQAVDPRVPDSVRYPLEEINQEFLSTLTYEGMKVQNYAATVAYCIALALYLKYDQIDLYGIELVHTEMYRRQHSNFAFWVGVATGRKVPVVLHCSRGTFDQPLYGYEVVMKKDKIESYLTGMRAQLEEEKRKVAMLEGAIQFAMQLQQDMLQEEQPEITLTGEQLSQAIQDGKETHEEPLQSDAQSVPAGSAKVKTDLPKRRG